MQLTALQITNYKSIEDSNHFTISDITCLVGKNESGKTAILRALEKLNPVVTEHREFDETEYPRHRLTEDYGDSSRSDLQIVLHTTWELEQSDRKTVAEALGIDVLTQGQVKIIKGYDNISRWTIPYDEPQLVKHITASSSLHEAEVSELGSPSSVIGLIDALSELESPSEKQTEFLEFLNQRYPEGDVHRALLSVLKSNLPRFLYFAEYFKLPGRVSLNEYKQKKQADNLEFDDRLFESLLALARTSPEEIDSIGRSEQLFARLEGVSNRLSREIFSYWSQNKHLEVDFNFDHGRPDDVPPFNDGYVFSTRIENTRHRVTVSFDDRSSGFVWFFSFLAWLSFIRAEYGENLVILLDEPALSLHARAQEDLLRYMKERLVPDYQVIYTTHSPFMIDAANLLSARTVEDVVIEHKDRDDELLGTKVGEDVLSTDRDTLFPLQAALGYDITQSLFIGPNVLLVEGPSDLLYLEWISSELRRRNRVSLDRQWVITPTNGISKVASFMTLFGANKLNVAVLADYAHGNKSEIRRIREQEILKSGHIFTADTYAEQNEADTEDIFGRKFMVDLMNKTYGLKGDQRLSAKKPSGESTRIVKEVEEHFRTLPPEIAEFDHYEPARALHRSSDFDPQKLQGLEEALNRFERLFMETNVLLEFS